MALFDQSAALFVLLLAMLLITVEIGTRMGHWLSVDSDQLRHEQLVAARDAIGLLLSLLLGFTLAMALSRFDQRQQLLVDEANAIGTAMLRVEMLPDSERGKMLALLRKYVDARMHFSEARIAEQGIDSAMTQTKQLQAQMWEHSVEAAKTTPTAITSLFIQALNDVIDLSEKRLAMLENRVPPAIWIMLTLISFLACLTVGMSVRRRFWYVMMITPLIISIVMSLIADLNNPRSGFLQTDRKSMHRLQQDLRPESGNR
jgi:Protein of unknown function (DUF4239)